MRKLTFWRVRTADFVGLDETGNRFDVCGLMQEMGKMMVAAGLVIALIGAIFWIGKGFRLPGDIFVERGHFSFAFPVVTCVVISILLTIVLNLFRR